MMNNIKKKIISILTLLTLIAVAYAGYKVLATATNEMLSKDDSLPPSFPYIEYNTLISDPYILCCGKGITLNGMSRTVVRSGDRQQQEPYLTMNDIGKKIFEETQNASGDVTSNNFENPYGATTSRTIGFYTESDKKVASPMESYILAEASENLPSQGSSFYNVTDREYTGDLDAEAYFYNVEGTIIYGVNIDENSGEPQEYVTLDEETGKYYYIEITNSGEFFPYTYVQYAWWKTPAGGQSSQVQSTPFFKEAEAFEAYINKVAKRDEQGKIVTEQKTVTVNGETATVTVPVIDYKISGEDDKSQVYYDEDNGRYLIGPFVLHYYEESVTTDRGTVYFSNITDATIVSNLGAVDNSKWFFKYTDRDADDKSTFPHNNEEFYIVMDYIEDMRYLTDIRFDFRYMNAGGEYSELKGEYFNASWEPESKAIWCNEGAKNCACGGHHTSAQYDSNNNLTCSGGAKKCSHGYYHNHIVKWEYWLELESLDPQTSQPLAQVYVGVRWYEKANYSFKAEFPPDEPGPKEYIKLTIPMAGEVWIDISADKKNPDFTDGKRENGEKGYKNAEVYIYKTYKNSSGKIVKRELADIYDEDNETKLKYPIYTDENGHYEIPNINVPGSGDMIENGYTIAYDVEFKYDGQHYEASPALPTVNGDAQKYIKASKKAKKTYENDSLATENEKVREQFNEKFSEIYGGKAIDKNGDTTGYAKNGNNTLKLDYTSEEYTSPDNSNKRRLSTLTTLDKNEHIIEQYKMTATTGNTGIYFPVNHKISLDTADDVVELSVIENEDGKTTTYKTIYDYMLHINFGVKQREKADLSVFKDLYKAEILVNEKEITKTYNKYRDVEEEENKDALDIQLEACKIGKYTIGLYSSDYEYRSTVYETSQEVVKNMKAGTDLKVYLTYRIAVNNESQAEEGLDATINQINDYYDKTFTLIDSDISANVLDDNQNRVNKVVAESPYYRVVKADEDAEYTYWSDNMERFKCNDTNKKVNKDYKKLTITDLKGTKLSAGDQLEMFITFEVDKDGYVGTTDRPELLGEKNNVAEIANYSTFYPNGKVAGLIDKDSAPDNIDLNRNVKEWYEDDTESAPATNIELYAYNREINGTVWEDQETVSLLYNQKVGDGLMEEQEPGIKNIDVQLVEKIKIDDIEYEKIWSEDDFKGLTDEEKKEYRLKDVETDENGYYYFKGVLAGNYVVRFKYGNKEANIKYNGQDYKNTAYQAEMLNEDETTTLNNEWQDLKTSNKLNETRVSDARDYELQRMKVIAYSKNINNQIGTVLESADNPDKSHTELIDNTQMVANTAKLNIEIEHQDFITYGTVKKVNGLQEFTYNVKDIDFGLEKRSETAMELDKKISKISLYKEDGETLLLNAIYNEDGTIDRTNPEAMSLNKLTHVDEQSDIQGLDHIHSESEFLNGATLKIEYTITLTNNSEVDWTGKISRYEKPEEIIAEVEKLEKSDIYVSGESIEYGEYVGLNYYNNKNNDTDEIVETKIEQIIDYIDNDISPDEDANSLVVNESWRKLSLDEIKNGKMLDEKVYTNLNGELTIADSKQRSFIGTNKNNILVSESEEYNPNAITKLVPQSAAEDLDKKSTGQIKVVSTKQLSEESSKDDVYNNVAEVLSYSNTVGRRDPLAVPGNAEIARGEYVAATGYQSGVLVIDYEGAKEITIGTSELHLNGERDTDASDYVSIAEPTGISIREYYSRNYYPIIALITGSILVVAIIVIKKKIKK